MSRSQYSDDCEDTLAYGRWRAQVASAIRGSRGQTLLKELATIMDAMSEKKLIKGDLAKNNNYCTLGLVCANRGLDFKKLDPYDSEMVGDALNIAHQLAQEIAHLNDEVCSHNTPEERWASMRLWVDRQIKKELL